MSTSPVLKRFLRDDFENYRKAIACLSLGYGIAAFAYWRRIVEDNIEELLELVQEDVKSTSAGEAIEGALAELRENSPMKEKIKIANRALPDYLKPDGLNPLGRLYQVLSQGVHRLSEEECSKKARATSQCLEYLVSELTTRKRNRDRLKQMVGSL